MLIVSVQLLVITFFQKNPARPLHVKVRCVAVGHATRNILFRIPCHSGIIKAMDGEIPCPRRIYSRRLVSVAGGVAFLSHAHR